MRAFIPSTEPVGTAGPPPTEPDAETTRAVPLRLALIAGISFLLAVGLALAATVGAFRVDIATEDASRLERRATTIRVFDLRNRVQGPVRVIGVEGTPPGAELVAAFFPEKSKSAFLHQTARMLNSYDRERVDLMQGEDMVMEPGFGETLVLVYRIVDCSAPKDRGLPLLRVRTVVGIERSERLAARAASGSRVVPVQRSIDESCAARSGS